MKQNESLRETVYEDLNVWKSALTLSNNALRIKIRLFLCPLIVKIAECTNNLLINEMHQYDNRIVLA